MRKPIGIVHTLQLFNLLKGAGMSEKESDSVSSTNLSFRTPGDLMQRLQARNIKGVKNPGAIAKRDVERWYSLLEASVSYVKVEPIEAVVMIYAANWHFSAMNSRTLEDLGSILRQEMGLNPFYADAQRTLAQKVEDWPLLVRAALWDAAERYDVLAHLRRVETFGAGLHQVGLHSYELEPEELARVEGLAAVEGDSLPEEYMRTVMEG